MSANLCFKILDGIRDRLKERGVTSHVIVVAQEDNTIYYCIIIPELFQ